MDTETAMDVDGGFEDTPDMREASQDVSDDTQQSSMDKEAATIDQPSLTSTSGHAQDERHHAQTGNEEDHTKATADGCVSRRDDEPSAEGTSELNQNKDMEPTAERQSQAVEEGDDSTSIPPENTEGSKPEQQQQPDKGKKEGTENPESEKEDDAKQEEDEEEEDEQEDTSGPWYALTSGLNDTLEDVVLSDPSFQVPGFSWLWVTQRTREEMTKNGWRCPVKGCTKDYKGISGLIYHRRASICSPTDKLAEFLSEKRELVKGKTFKNDEAFSIRDRDVLFSYQHPDRGDIWWTPLILVRLLVGEQRIEELHPELEMRRMDKREIKFLVHQQVLAPTAIFAEQVLTVHRDSLFTILEENFPEVHDDYVLLRTQLSSTNSQAAVPDMASNKAKKLIGTAALQASMFNKALIQERRDDRHMFYDPHTQITHYPRRFQVHFQPVTGTADRYPVATFGPQKCSLPLKMSARDLDDYANPPKRPAPPKLVESVLRSRAAAEAEKGKNSTLDSIRQRQQKMVFERAAAKENVALAPKPDQICGVCGKQVLYKADGTHETLLVCNRCESASHPSCLNMSPEMTAMARTYPWKCMDCKTCESCAEPHDEDKLLVCDECDRSYHTYCVDLDKLPRSRWVCPNCGQCYSCGTRSPDADDPAATWVHVHDTRKQGRPYLCTLCLACAGIFEQGKFCPVCLEVYKTTADPSHPMISCDSCARWLHADCEKLSEAEYRDFVADNALPYICTLCRGDRQEVYDAFHKRNLTQATLKH